jgi:chromosome segregation ATPase
MSRQRSLKVLIGVRERRAQALTDAVTAAMRAREAAVAAERAAVAAVGVAVEAEAAGIARLRSTTDRGEVISFEAITTRRYEVEAMKERVVQQQQAADRCADEIVARKNEVRTRRADVTRNEQKIDALRADIKALLAAKQQVEDDDQDEEAEETAISRMIREARAATAEEASE